MERDEKAFPGKAESSNRAEFERASGAEHEQARSEAGCAADGPKAKVQAAPSTVGP
jgi:hypothetical protein